MKPVVMGLVVKRDEAGYFSILTQLRMVRNKTYDPLYDRTHEIVGETLEPNENILDGLVRGVAEECGKPGFKPKAIYGAGLQELDAQVYTTGKGDRILGCEPFCFVQQLGPPQPWLGPVFIVEADTDFEPDHRQSDGEAAEPKWWNPWHLKEVLKSKPHRFMGLHLPALLKASTLLNAENVKLQGLNKYRG